MNKIDCPRCKSIMIPVKFEQKEYNNGIPTGRKKVAVSHFLCENCGKETIVDDSFDGPWYY